ncbi:MAG: ATP-binding protein [Bacteroidota bacterium]
MNKTIFYILFALLNPLIGLAQFDSSVLRYNEKIIIDSIEALSNYDKMLSYEKLCWERRLYNSKVALDYGQKALQLAKTLNEQKHQATLYNYLGVIKRNINDYPTALEYYFKAQYKAEEIDLITEKAYALNNIGDIYNRKKNYSSANKYISEALELFTREGDKSGMAYCNKQLALVMKNMDKHETALMYFFKALKLRKELADTKGVGVEYNNIGEIYYSQNDLVKAKLYFSKSLNLLKGSKDLASICLVNLNMGKYYFQVDSIELAKKHLQESFIISRNYEFNARTSEALYYLSEIYSKETDYKLALNYYKTYKTISDSILNDENTAMVTRIEMQRKYDEQIKIREISALKKDKKTNLIITILGIIILIVLAYAIGLYRINKIKQKANNELAAKNREIIKQQEKLKKNSHELEEYNQTKEKLFSIIAHDLKNPYSAIIGFTNLLISDLEVKEYSNIKRFAQTILKASQQNYDLLVNLLEWANTQTNAIKFKPEIINIKEFINDIIEIQTNAALQKNISISCKAENISVHADKNMLNTILRNLLSNAIKYSPPGKKINVNIEKNAGAVEFNIKDEGIGIDQKDIDKLFRIDNNFSKQGTNQERGTGLGLILCKEFVEKHNGEIWVESSVDKGSKFSFKIPLSI